MKSEDDNTRSTVVLTSGMMVSHYRIIEKIGAGGMGEVYLAEDTKLNRNVALKFLPIRISCCDKMLDRRQHIENKGIRASSFGNPKASYTGRKPELRILCGSI